MIDFFPFDSQNHHVQILEGTREDSVLRVFCPKHSTLEGTKAVAWALPLPGAPPGTLEVRALLRCGRWRTVVATDRQVPPSRALELNRA